MSPYEQEYENGEDDDYVELHAADIDDPGLNVKARGWLAKTYVAYVLTLAFIGFCCTVSWLINFIPRVTSEPWHVAIATVAVAMFLWGKGGPSVFGLRIYHGRDV